MNGLQDLIPGIRRIIQRGDGSDFPLDKVRPLLGFLAFVAAYYAGYRYGMSFSQAAASPFWFPDSILLCALLVTAPRHWWLLVAATLPIRLFSEVAEGIPTWFLLATFAIDSAKGIATALLLRWSIEEPIRLKTVREFSHFFLYAVLLVPAAGALCGATVRSFLGHSFWLSWEQWFLGNALAQIIVTPTILYWVLGPRWDFKRIKAKRLVEGGLVAAGLIVTGFVAFNTEFRSLAFAESRYYAPIPFLFWAAIRFGMFGASGAITVLAFFAIEAALLGRGSFAGQSPGDIALTLQNFLLLRAAPLFLVAALTEQRWGVERRLRESEDRFRSMANTAPILMWVSDHRKNDEFFNQSWLEFTGRSLRQEFATNWSDRVHPDDARQYLEAYTAAFDARATFETEYRLRRHDGIYRWMLQKAAPRWAPNGDFAGYIGSAIDITDRKQVEEKSQKLSHAQRLVVLGQLSATIAHEIRQPLAAILSNAGAARMLLNSPEPPLNELREIIADIRQDDLRADEVIGRIRDFLRQRNREMQPLDMNVAVADVLRFVAGDARQRNVEIRTDLAGGLPLVTGDRTQLQQVLLNLIVNGMDAMRDEPAASRHLTVRTGSSEQGDVMVTVEDSGRGIAPDDLRKLFEPFYTTSIEGMGLGLSIAQSIIAAHHGQIWAESSHGGGAKFHFTVPVMASRSERQAG